MARTVDTSSTFENWRQNYNDLATDVGALGNLTTGNKTSIVSAVNFIMDQYFFFQDFDFDGQDGATSNTVFSGNDNAGNSLAYSAGKVLVYKNGLLLRSGTDYTATNGTSITLASSASNSSNINNVSHNDNCSVNSNDNTDVEDEGNDNDNNDSDTDDQDDNSNGGFSKHCFLFNTIIQSMVSILFDFITDF